MADTLQHIDIMNNALARIGAGAIMDIEEDSDLASQVKAVYFDVLDATLAQHPYSFAGKTYKLTALAKDPANDYDATAQIFNTGYRHAFLLPGNRIGDPRKILTDARRPDDPLRDFLIEAGCLYADIEQAWAVCTVRADPDWWEPQFRLAFTKIVAAELCVPVTHDANLAKTIGEDAVGTPSEQGRGGAIGRAMATDAARTRQVAPMWGDPLTAARLG